jgi:hypothetical protein
MRATEVVVREWVPRESGLDDVSKRQNPGCGYRSGHLNWRGKGPWWYKIKNKYQQIPMEPSTWLSKSLRVRARAGTDRKVLP